MEDNKVLVVLHKRYCGKDYYYPDNDTAKTLLSMSKSSGGARKAFLEADIEKLKGLGYEIKMLEPRVIYE